jgi:N-acetylglucosamine-6-phosphate deacetylase
MRTPGYVDLQVNGYAGVDFNSDAVTLDQFHTACERLRNDGVSSILATIITDDLDRMCTRLRAIIDARSRDATCRDVIAGIHIEGPFISPVDGYRGAHPLDAVMPAEPSTMQRLLDAAAGLTRLVTLAPEQDPGGAVTRTLSSQNIRVAAGHTDASLDQLRRALDAGLSLFTHLGNAGPMHGMHRHDNIVQRALSLRDRFDFFTFIADGVHVPPFALRNYIDLVGIDRSIVVTDAIAPASLGPGRYTLGRWDLLVGDDNVARAPDGSHFVGSAITMPQSERNLTEKLGFDDSACRAMLIDNPRRALGGTP